MEKGSDILRAVYQRVKEAKVTVDGQVTGSIGKGALIFLGIAEDDTEKDLDYIVDKCINLRLFEDKNGRFNLSLKDVSGEVLLVSQFTLLGDCRRGRRPSFSQAMAPEDARKMYQRAIEKVRSRGIRCESGVFQAHMEVSLVNDGPVTVLIDSKKEF